MKFGFFRVVSEEKIFEIVDDSRRTTTDAGAWVYYKLTCEPSAQVSQNWEIAVHSAYDMFAKYKHLIVK